MKAPILRRVAGEQKHTVIMDHAFSIESRLDFPGAQAAEASLINPSRYSHFQWTV